MIPSCSMIYRRGEAFALNGNEFAQYEQMLRPDSSDSPVNASPRQQ